MGFSLRWCRELVARFSCGVAANGRLFVVAVWRFGCFSRAPTVTAASPLVPPLRLGLPRLRLFFCFISPVDPPPGHENQVSLGVGSSDHDVATEQAEAAGAITRKQIRQVSFLVFSNGKRTSTLPHPRLFPYAYSLNGEWCAFLLLLYLSAPTSWPSVGANMIVYQVSL